MGKKPFYYFEETSIEKNDLPPGWSGSDSPEVLRQLSDYLQFNWDQRYLFFDDKSKTPKQQFLSFEGFGGIRTNNYIGTISFAGEQIFVFPKVFLLEESEGYSNQQHLFRNILKWLNYCRKSNYPFINSDSSLEDDNDLQELFITIYLGYLLDALKKSRYHKYEEKTEDLGKIKGKIDLKDYIQRKYLHGKGHLFQSEYSEFEFDNKLNQIIKYTCRSLLKKTVSEKNRQRIRDVLRYLHEVSDEVCTPHDCDTVKLNSLFRRYSTVLSMSKMFLMNKTTNLLAGSQDSFCFLFPTELLFEGFISGYIYDMLRDQAKVTLQACDKYVFSDLIYNKSLGRAFQTRQDIVISFKNDTKIILDTKYKKLSRFEGNGNLKDDLIDTVPSSDLYQMITYANLKGVSDVYLLYPLMRFENPEPENPMGIYTSESKTVNIHFIRLPFVFEDNPINTEETLRSVLNSIFEKYL